MFNNRWFFEIKCNAWTSGRFEYYYCIADARRLRSARAAKTNAIPDKCRLVMDDRYAEPCAVTPLGLPQYIWRKYFKRRFHWGKRINWEKEKIFD